MAGSTPAAPPSDNVLLVGPLNTFQLVVFFIIFTGIALYNGAELLITIFLSFRRSTSCYFFSLVATTVGVIVYQTFIFLLIYGKGLTAYSVCAGIDIGWTLMVTGQSMVLWSRLHLVCRSRWKLRAILIMIIVNGVVLHPTEIALTMNAVVDNVLDPTNVPFIVSEKVTVVIFFVQEVIISCVYMYETLKILRVGEAFHKKNARRKMKEPIAANAFIIALDVTLLALEYSALWGIWCSFKGLAYSIKVKIEFTILNQLKSTLTNRTGGAGGAAGSGPYNRSAGGNHHETGGRGNIEMDPFSKGGHTMQSQAAGGGGMFHHQKTVSSDNEGSTNGDQIMKTTEFTVTHNETGSRGSWNAGSQEPKSPGVAITRKGSRSGSSAEVAFANHGA